LPRVDVALDGVPGDRLADAVEPLRAAGVDVHVGASEREVLWRKAARLAPLAAVTSATGLAVGGILGDPGARETLAAALREACAVAAGDGAPVDPAAQWAMIEALPPALTTSTARDVAAGRPSELDAIVGSVVRAGRRLGVPTPVLDDLLGRLHAA
jgi:2-dehydropantoate 2-reductase